MAQTGALSQARAAADAKNWDSARQILQDYLSQHPDAADFSAAKTLSVDCLRSKGEALIAQADAKLGPAEQEEAHDQRVQGETLLAQYRQEGLLALADGKLSSEDHNALDTNIGASLEGMIDRSLKVLDRADALPSAEDTSRSRTLRDEWLGWDAQYRVEAKKLVDDPRLGETARTRLKNRIRWGMFHLYREGEFLLASSIATTVTAHPDMAASLKEQGIQAMAIFQRDAGPLIESSYFTGNIADRLKRRYMIAFSQQGKYPELEAFAGKFAQEFPKGSVQWALGRLNVAISMSKHAQPDWSEVATIIDEIIACQSLAGDHDDHMMVEAAFWRAYCASQLKDQAKVDSLAAWVREQLADSPVKQRMLKRFDNSQADMASQSPPPIAAD
jgi:hypothetical protein